MRWKITIEYDGTLFAGWQRQKNAPSVQETLETALEAFSAAKTAIHGAGRTDRGVHAKAQIAHFDLPDDKNNLTPQNIIGAFNFHLNRPDIAVTNAEKTDNDFHARFSASGRVYQYQIINQKTPSPLCRHTAWQIPYELNINRMQNAAQKFIGKHDFSSFRAAQCQAKSPIRTLQKLDIDRLTTHAGENKIIITAEAPSFLHHQVRNIVATLIACGREKLSSEDIPRLIEAKNRSLVPPTAPAHGLCLMRILYAKTLTTS